MLLYILLFVAYLSVGTMVGRGQYAREVYRRSLWNGHNTKCKSYKYEDPKGSFSRMYCTCNFFKKTPDTSKYMCLVLFWFPWIMYAVPQKIVTGGTYEPRDVKAKRKEREAQELVERFEARTHALEVAAGIRKK